MAVDTRFCSVSDGIQIGYSTFGAGRPLVIVPGWWMSPRIDRERTTGRDFWAGLPPRRMTLAYDVRGVGASTRSVSDVSLAAQVEDLRVLTEHLGLEQFDLWCFHDGVAAGVAFAARFPERVSRLALYNPWAHVPAPVAHGHMAAWGAIIQYNWGLASRLFAQLLYPKGPVDAQESSTVAIRQSQSPEVAALYLEYVNTYDVRDMLGALSVPTLVISREGPGNPPLVPRATVEQVARAIPGSRFVQFEAASAVCPYFEYGDYGDAVTAFFDQGSTDARPKTVLSAREIEVLRLIAQGRTNAEIAGLLTISRNTANRHVSNLLAKTGTSNRAEAVLYAARNGLVE